MVKTGRLGTLDTASAWEENTTMRTRQQVWILIALATGVCVVPTCFAQRIPPTAVPYGNSWALLIGVNKYQNFPGNLQLR